MKGRVTIGGVGPGDPELVTLKLCAALKTADVVVTDRLVNPVIIETHAGQAEIIFAGKQGYNENSYKQEDISQLLVDKALEGKHVARLKGGDVAFFSNVLSELRALHKHNIPFEIIPGITAASAASAYTGIPLTARDYSNGVRFISYRENNNWTDADWESLRQTSDTIVLYMSTRNAPIFFEGLFQKQCINKSVAIVQQASTPAQKVVTFQLQDRATFLFEKLETPAVFIVGNVVDLFPAFQWFHPIPGESVFLPMVCQDLRNL